MSDISFERSFDRELIRSIITHPRIYPHVTDDASPKAEEYQIVDPSFAWYVLVRDKAAAILGLFIFVPMNAICAEVHTCLLPRTWGADAKRAAHGAANWMWANTTCKRIITNVPASNRLALKFARQSGMKQFGVNEKSILKHGRLEDQILLGLSPEV